MTAARLRRWSGPVAATLLAWGAAGCGDLLQEPDTGFAKVPVHLEKASGDGQSAAPGAALGEPLRVRVLADGEPAPRLRVEWSVLAGGGTVDPRNTFSDANGIAETRWILGPSDDPQQVRAVVRKGVSVSFDATSEGL